MRSKYAIAVIIILFAVGAVVALRLMKPVREIENKPIPYREVCEEKGDQFLCLALQKLSVEEFEDKIQSGSVDSFDGANNVVRTWAQDVRRNYHYSATTNGVQTDEALNVSGKHYTKDLVTGIWTIAVERISEDARETIVGQLSLDEILGQLYVGSGELNEYAFKWTDDEDCDGTRCRRYVASFGGGEPVYRREYLYFAEHTHQLVRYDEEAPEYQAVHRYAYTPIPSITPPATK